MEYWNITRILRNIIGLFWIIGILRKIVEYFGLLWNIIGLLDFWNIMEYYGLMPNLYTQIIVASPRTEWARF